MDKKGVGGQKMSIFVHTQGIKTVLFGCRSFWNCAIVVFYLVNLLKYSSCRLRNRENGFPMCLQLHAMTILDSLYLGLPIKPIWNTFLSQEPFHCLFYNNWNCFIIIIEIRKVMIIIFISKLCDRNNSIQKPNFSTFGVLTLFDKQ